MDKKRREQEERQRKQLELEQILEDNRRRVRAACACTIQGQVAGRAPECTPLCRLSARQGRVTGDAVFDTCACSCPQRQDWT